MDDLSKSFDSVLHGLLIAKLDAYDYDENALFYFFSYLTEREHTY